MAIFKLIEKSHPYKNSNNTLFHYRDEKQRDVFFRDSNIPFEYSLAKGTHEDFINSKSLKLIAGEYVDKGLHQHDYEGGYEEAIATLTIKML